MNVPNQCHSCLYRLNSKRKIAFQTGNSRSTRKKYLWAFTRSKLTVKEVNPSAIKTAKAFYEAWGKPVGKSGKSYKRFFLALTKSERKSRTRQLLREQYTASHSDGFGFFMRNHHLAVFYTPRLRWWLQKATLFTHEAVHNKIFRFW